jgi:hypothetical protein
MLNKARPKTTKISSLYIPTSIGVTKVGGGAPFVALVQKPENKLVPRPERAGSRGRLSRSRASRREIFK